MVYEALKLFAKMFLIITVLITVFFYLLAIFLGPALFYFTPQGLNTGMIHLPELPFWFFTTIGFNIPIGLDYSVIFFFLLWWNARMQKEILAKVRKFAQKQIETMIKEIDRLGRGD